MYLKSIEISGFKSFAKKSILEFNTPISAIVGPNGSGKSNVAEAFRFVLGEQSIKSLRGKKGEDLIFNGADAGQRANRASVKVIFDNTSKVFNLDFPEVSVERTVHRDGVNEYSINGSQVRLRDVIELLANAHIGASGHHIISQGEADRILNSSAKERRAMLEDALGLKIYQYKRAESERKLEKTDENIQSVESLRREIAPHLKFLKRQVEKLEKAREMKDGLVDMAKEYFKRESVYIEHGKNDIESKRAPLVTKKNDLEREMADARAVLESSKSKDEKSETLIKLEGNIHANRVEKDKFLQEMGKIEGEIGSEERILAKQKVILSSNEHRTIALKDVEELVSTARSKLENAESSSDIGAIRSILIEVKNFFQQFIESKKDHVDDSVVRESEVTLKHLQDAKNDISQKIETIRNEETRLQTEYETLKGNIEKEKDSSRDAEKALFRIMSEQSDVSGKLALLKAEEDTLVVVENDFKRELGECAAIVGREMMEYQSFDFAQDVSFEEPRSAQEERRRAIEKVKIRLEEAGLSGSVELMKEYEETSERDTFLERELVDLHSSSGSLRKLIDELGVKLDTEFKVGIEKINTQFGEFFTLMFGGGSAELKLTKPQKKKARDEDELTNDLELTSNDLESFEASEDEPDGIEIEVSLPRKKIKGLVMLSGGERALTSIALLFAISQVNPPPFIILDETDAALDEANSKKYGDMVENLAKYSQLIVITHNRETMSRAGVIYGVTMGSSGISKLLSIQFEEAVVVAK